MAVDDIMVPKPFDLVPHWYMYPPKTSYSAQISLALIEREILKLSGKPVSIYVHIPFCDMKCNFCSLFTSSGHSDSAVSAYVSTLGLEIENFSRRFDGTLPAPSVLYFGGGTPALLPEDDVAYLLECLRRAFDFTFLHSRSVEFSPDVVAKNTASRWARHGFNRASLGVQSFNDAALKSMGRHHSGRDARNAVNVLADAGYADINVDLIFGYLGQTAISWDEDLRAVVDSPAMHCTFHPLATREKTVLERKAISGTPPSEMLVTRHAEAIAHFDAAGWTQTSAISFSRSSVPNPLERAEATGQPTIGFGAGSRSYYTAVHTSSVPYAQRVPFGSLLKLYEKAVRQRNLPVANAVLVDQLEAARRLVILEMHHGSVRADTLSALNALTLDNSAMEIMERMLASDWFDKTPDGYRLTSSGSVHAAEIGLAFASGQIQRSLASIG